MPSPTRVRQLALLGLVPVVAMAVLPSAACAGATRTAPARRPEAAPGWNLIRPLAILAAGGILTAVSWSEADPDAMSRNLEQVGPIEPLVDIGSTYGGGWVAGGGSAAVLAAGAMSGNDDLRAFGIDLCQAFVFSGLATRVVKHSIDRKRPSGGGLSFPSGHTAVAFATVPVIAHHLGWQAGLAAGLIATHTGLARMEDKKHFLSDVLTGAAIGLAVGDLVTQRRARQEWTASLVVTPGFVGYAMRF